MWTLPSPTTGNVITHLNKALTRADGTSEYPASADELSRLLTLYTDYDAGQGAPQDQFVAPATLSDAFCEAIYAAYSQVQKRRRLAYLRNELLAAAPRCPYCGINAVTDLDHFIPKQTYRCFSIYCRNLIPCCSVCNGKKHALGGENETQRFLHPYLEAAPAGLFFRAQASISSGALKVVFDVDDAIVTNEILRDRLRHQIARLNLNERYEPEINVVLSPFTEHLLGFGDSPNSAPQVESFLRRSAASERRNVGENHWRPLLFEALAACPDFCNGGFRQSLGSTPP